MVTACTLLPNQSPAAPPTPTPFRTPLPSGVSPQQISIYFPRYFEDGSLGLRAAQRTVGSDAPALHALEALIAGPDGSERADDLEYPLDRHTQVRSFAIANGIATIELGPELDQVRGQPFSELAYWSIVFTLTEQPGVRGVALVRDGAPLRQFGYPPVPIQASAGRDQAPAWTKPR
jgi:spore germination protein GerM